MQHGKGCRILNILGHQEFNLGSFGAENTVDLDFLSILNLL